MNDTRLWRKLTRPTPSCLRMASCLAAVFVVLAAAPRPVRAAALFERELDLPARGLSQRVTQRPQLLPGKTVVLFDEQGPGCLLHWWLTCSHGRVEATGRERIHDLRLRFYYDGQQQPAVDMTLAQFFAILLQRDTFQVDNAAFKVLPKNAFNCYWPIPFRRLRIELENTGPAPATIWFMGDWQQYPADTELTPLRFRAIWRSESPAEPFGSFLMADLAGEGFLAGMVMGVGVLDRTDAWYHNGGDLVLLDGESAPRAIRGIGGEDGFNMSFGIWPVQTDWVGAPYTSARGEDNPLGSAYDGIMYRIFGPDPIWFDHSAVVRFGSKANHLESVVYAYAALRPPPKITTPAVWKLAGPFACDSEAAFERSEWAERPLDQWPERHTADFDPYISRLRQMPAGPTTFEIPVEAPSEHAWCDFARHFRGRQPTNNGAQPAGTSAYALGRISLPEAGTYLVQLGYDDWITLWADGRKVHTGRHDHGFQVDRVPLELPAGPTTLLVKLSNSDNLQWRLWAFALRVEKKP